VRGEAPRALLVEGALSPNLEEQFLRGIQIGLDCL